MATASKLASFVRGQGGRSSFSGHVVTVFGATGFIGRYAVNRLGKIGSQVVVPFRQDQCYTRHLRVMGDLGQLIFTPYHIENEESIYSAVKYSNAVVNMTGRNYTKFLSRFSSRDIHVDGAARIARICREAGVERLIHFSALGADSNSSHFYRRDKGDGEQAVLEEFPSATILRPANVLGFEDRFLNYFGVRAGLKVAPMISSMVEAVKQPVYVCDVAGAVVKCLENSSTAGNVYELVGPKQYSMLDLVKYLYAVMYRPFYPVPLPERLYMLSIWGYEFSPKRPLISRSEALQIFSPDVRTPGMGNGLESLGLQPTPVEEYALACIRRYRMHTHMTIPIDQVQQEA